MDEHTIMRTNTSNHDDHHDGDHNSDGRPSGIRAHQPAEADGGDEGTGNRGINRIGSTGSDMSDSISVDHRNDSGSSNNNNSNDVDHHRVDHHYDEEEEEDECRVCRSPAEENRPLYKPCKCSGSIGLTHQDCLQSWLEVQRGGIHNGSCELCKTSFRFLPQYAPLAPQRLPMIQVFIGLSRRCLAKWLPFIIRLVFATSLWLLVAPLITAYLYHGWMDRPSAIMERFHWTLVTTDLVSGAVVAAYIIISFLSLMSFADFLRVEWQQRGWNNPHNHHAQQQQQQLQGGGGRVVQQQRPIPIQQQRRRQQQQQPPLVPPPPGRRLHNHHRGGGGLIMLGGGPMAQQLIGPPAIPREEDIDNAIWIDLQQDIVARHNHNSNSSNSNNNNNSRTTRAEGGENNDTTIINATVSGSATTPVAMGIGGRGLRRPAGTDVDEVDLLASKRARMNPYQDRSLTGGSSSSGSSHHRQPRRRPNSNNNNNNKYDHGDDDDNDHDRDNGIDEDDNDSDDPSWHAGSASDNDEEEGDDELMPDDYNDEEDDDEEEEDDNNNNEDNHHHQEDDEENEEDDMPELEPLVPGGLGLGLGPHRHEPLNDEAMNRQRDLLPQQQQRNDVRLERPFDFDQDDPVDVDINIALDELLGIRGPLISVIRNLLWLLAFNAVYVGCFCFVPRTVGTAVSSLIFNTTTTTTTAAIYYDHEYSKIEEDNSLFFGMDSSSNNNIFTPNNTCSSNNNNISDQSYYHTTHLLLQSNNNNLTTLWSILRAVERESQRHKTAFRLNDLATVTLGYLVFAAGVVFCRFLWTMSEKIGIFRAAGGRRTGHHHPDVDEMREAMDEMNRIVHGQGGGGGNNNNDVPQLDEPPGVALSLVIGIALDALMAIVKVGILLLLKMFMLPIVLGICLDASVMSLVGGTLEDRVTYAGKDLFAFVLLHWVFGITFMLLVTVSVLQLREVAHPDLLAQMIRPQEPQPDLLGNLMHESLATHTRRMILSLIIYAVLLSMHVYIPVQLVTWFGIDQHLPFYDLKFYYFITPRLQVPLELLFFHLCMLGLLEKYKNCIGDMQHRWLKFLTRILNLMDCVLPRSVDGFRYLGSRRVFQEQHVLDNFWTVLTEGKQNREEYLVSQLDSFQQVKCSSPFVVGITKNDGQRTLGLGTDYIRLPVRLPGRTFRSRSILLPSKIGRYRLKHEQIDSGNGQHEHMIHILEEVPGAPIPRPPEGWDDLGVEPPDVQGRWAWGNEKKSAIEGGVAHRNTYFPKGQSWGSFLFVCTKLFTMLFLSWVATTLLLGLVFTAPLAVGRFMYFIFRVPNKWIHDPIAFGLGMMVLYPVARTTGRVAFAGDAPLWRRLLMWMLRFHFPTLHKLAVLCYSAILWFGLAPIFLGAVYDMFFVRSRDFFLGTEALADTKTLLMCWATGTALLYIWSDLCIAGVLTRRFRIFLFEGRDVVDDHNLRGHLGGAGAAAAAAAVAAAADAAADAWHDLNHGPFLRTWQGEYGRMSRFWETIRAVVYDWEWDKVDEDVLLWECAWPVTAELFWAMIIPVASMVLCFWRFPYVSGLHRAILVRLLIAIVGILQVSLVWRDQLMDWFEAAHKTARDDLYLIGEVLLNYGEE